MGDLEALWEEYRKGPPLVSLRKRKVKAKPQSVSNPKDVEPRP